MKEAIKGTHHTIYLKLLNMQTILWEQCCLKMGVGSEERAERTKKRQEETFGVMCCSLSWLWWWFHKYIHVSILLSCRCCCCCYVASVVSDSVRSHRRQPTRLPHPWDSPGKNTGVGCHFLLQCMKVKSESEVARSCLTLRNTMDCSLPGSSIHGICQAGVLEWVAI